VANYRGVEDEELPPPRQGAPPLPSAFALHQLSRPESITRYTTCSYTRQSSFRGATALMSLRSLILKGGGGHRVGKEG